MASRRSLLALLAVVAILAFNFWTSECGDMEEILCKLHVGEGYVVMKSAFSRESVQSANERLQEIIDKRQMKVKKKN